MLPISIVETFSEWEVEYGVQVSTVDPFSKCGASNFAFQKENAMSCIEEVGAFVVTEMAMLFLHVKIFTLELACGISKIVVERDMHNNATDEPPCSPT